MSIAQGTILKHKDALGNAFYLTVEEVGYFNASNTNGFSARADDNTLHVFYEGDDKHMEVISTPNPNAKPNCDTCFGTGTVSGRYGSSYTCTCAVLKTVSEEVAQGQQVIDSNITDFILWLNEGGAA